MKVTVIDNKLWGKDHGFLTVNSLEFAALYRAGQMCMLSTTADGHGADPLLKRPFAPYSVDKTSGNIEFAYNIVGKGTALLAKQQAGTILSISVPHGKPFTLKNGAKVALVGGGVGIAPIHYLAEQLHINGCDVTVYYGARTGGDILPQMAAENPFKVNLYTEDGSIGRIGFATSQFKDEVAEYEFCYTCGPKPMMRVAQEIAATANKPIEVSLEETMGCGIGVCAGCMVSIRDDNGVVTKRCCTEGPVFDGHKVVW
jgi:dihydroorotate dehydrogenase electron transfer subunit